VVKSKEVHESREYCEREILGALVVDAYSDYLGGMTYKSTRSLFITLLAATVLPITPFFLTASAQDKAVYHVNGVIKALPGNGRAANEVLIKHDPIPEYRDISGKVVGMHGMTMPFYLAAEVSIAELSIGDAVSFELSAAWKPTFVEKITSIRKVDPPK
jgi:Cu/Ag efflux protein CusF